MQQIGVVGNSVRPRTTNNAVTRHMEKRCLYVKNFLPNSFCEVLTNVEDGWPVIWIHLIDFGLLSKKSK